MRLVGTKRFACDAPIEGDTRSTLPAWNFCIDEKRILLPVHSFPSQLGIKLFRLVKVDDPKQMQWQSYQRGTITNLPRDFRAVVSVKLNARQARGLNDGQDLFKFSIDEYSNLLNGLRGLPDNFVGVVESDATQTFSEHKTESIGSSRYGRLRVLQRGDAADFDPHNGRLGVNLAQCAAPGKQSSQRVSGIFFPHQRFSNQKCLKSRGPQSCNVLRIADAAFRDMQWPGG